MTDVFGHKLQGGELESTTKTMIYFRRTLFFRKRGVPGTFERVSAPGDCVRQGGACGIAALPRVVPDSRSGLVFARRVPPSSISRHHHPCVSAAKVMVPVMSGFGMGSIFWYGANRTTRAPASFAVCLLTAMG